MIKKLIIVSVLLLAGAYLNSRHSPTNAVADRIVDRAVEFVDQSGQTAVGLASDVQSEVSK